jgi:predicted enzyme related to lactoylglutathione lyase
MSAHPACGIVLFQNDRTETMNITSIDHVVLTVQDPDASIAFYTRVLGMTAASCRMGVKHSQ